MTAPRPPATTPRRPGVYRRLCGAAILLLLGALTCATPEERYETLSLFFDGVPRPGEEPEKDAAPAEKPLNALQIRELNAKRDMVFHGPYEGGYCQGCHAGRYRSRLRMDKTELCRNCHVEWEPGGKNVHGPVQAGWCIGCHHPHESKNPYMLVDTGGALCMKCHTLETFPELDDHREGMGETCTDCHDPHASDERFFLR